MLRFRKGMVLEGLERRRLQTGQGAVENMHVLFIEYSMDGYKVFRAALSH